jgi:hypothetical protein
MPCKEEQGDGARRNAVEGHMLFEGSHHDAEDEDGKGQRLLVALPDGAMSSELQSACFW